MKTIVFLGAGLSSGGAEHQCSLLMNLLSERGYDVTYVSFGDIEDHYFVSPLVKRVQLAPDKSTIKKIIAVEWFLLRVRADVVVAFSQRLSVLTLFPMLFRPFVKVISSERNYTIGEPDIFEKILIHTGIYRRANYIVPNNYSQGRYLADRMPALQKKIHVITNFTDPQQYKPTSLPSCTLPHVGIFCRFEQQKNFHRFIEALYLLKQKRGVCIHVDWYGNHKFKSDKQKRYYEEGINRIKEYALEEMFSIHNPTKDVASLISNFDVMCLPSLHEGFSNSISEYICCGRPVICSDVSDNSVMVYDGENGFLFNPLVIEDILGAFERYLDTTEIERDRMGHRSRAIAEQLFDKERFISNYIKLIEA